MSPRNTIRDWARLLYYLSQNAISLIGVVLTTSSVVTLIAFWLYDFMLPGPPHPYVGILLFLILPALFILGLVLIPIGILLHRRTCEPPGNCRPAIMAVLRQILLHIPPLVNLATLHFHLSPEDSFHTGSQRFRSVDHHQHLAAKVNAIVHQRHKISALLSSQPPRAPSGYAGADCRAAA